jgi:hypothetical protein
MPLALRRPAASLGAASLWAVWQRVASLWAASRRATALCLLALLLVPSASRASPWAEPGDAQLRSDIEILAAYGLIDNLTTTWPLPWAQVARMLKSPPTGLPPHVRQSLARVRARFDAQTALHQPAVRTQAAVTSEPTLVRGFDARARQEIDARAGVEYLWNSTAARLNLGLQSDFGFDDTDVALDGSYVAQELGNWLVYAGYLDHWWGGGWVGSLILSNNARPFPKIGVMRNNPHGFETPWLSWIGPWQINAFVGVLEDDFQDVENPAVVGGRLAFSPFSWLELGASRTIQICGDGRPCSLKTWWRAVTGNDNDVDPDPSNQLAGFDARISSRVGDYPFSVYAQYIGEDEAGGLPSKAAGLVGASVAGPVGRSGGSWRATIEYADTATSVLSGDKNYNVLYESRSYPSGYRYRGRALGHSVDNDAKIFSATFSLTDTRDWTYRLGYHHARLNRDDVALRNTVSATSETVNLLEVGVDVPWDYGVLSVSFRFQDDQPDTPGDKDFLFAAEAGWAYKW